MSNRMDSAVIVVLVAIGAIGGFLIAQAIRDNPATPLIVLGYEMLVPAFCIWSWRRTGHDLIATLSWTVPLAAWLAAPFIFDLHTPIRQINLVAGLVFAIAMLLHYPTKALWYRLVLRRTES